MQFPPTPVLRDAQPEDRAFLDQLFHACHRDEFAPLGLPEPQLAGLLDMQARAQRMSYAREFPYAVERVVLGEAREPIGRVIVSRGSSAMHLIDISLLPEYRGRGIGTQLMREVIAEAGELPVRLTVRPGNPALKLYTRLGFLITAVGVQLEMERQPGALPSTEQRLAAADAVRPNVRSPLRAQFQPLLGAPFQLLGQAGAQVPVLRLHSCDSPPPPPGGDCLSLIFTGPLEPVLPQDTYSLTVDAPEADLGVLQPLLSSVFMVPVGPEADVMQYEVVFNLLP